MNIIVRNIQSIKEGKDVFPDKGLVRIIGNNSNGKSILVKVMGDISMMRILDNDTRRSLINDNEVEGSVTIQYGDKVLLVKLHEDRNSCFVVLQRGDGERITRTFRDGGIKELLDEFGFRTYCNNLLCLQVHETFGIMPFVNLNATGNGEIVESITTDHVAKAFLENFEKFTHKKAKAKVTELSDKVKSLEQNRKSLVLFEEDKYIDIYNRMHKVYGVLKDLEPIALDLLKLPPSVSIVDIQPPKLKEIKFVTPVPCVEGITSMESLLSEYKDIREGKCPTCGKALIGDTCGGIL